jgi:hypothetical protein
MQTAAPISQLTLQAKDSPIALQTQAERERYGRENNIYIYIYICIQTKERKRIYVFVCKVAKQAACGAAACSIY